MYYILDTTLMDRLNIVECLLHLCVLHSCFSNTNNDSKNDNYNNKVIYYITKVGPSCLI